MTAPRLYSNAVYLYYLKNMAKVGLSVYGISLATSAEDDVRDFLSQAIQDSIELYNMTAKILLAKGLFVRPPFLATSNDIDFIDEKSYLGGLFNFDNRPLNVIEIMHIQGNVETNTIGSILLTGLSQAANSKEVSDYCMRGKKIAQKNTQVLSKILTDDDIMSPMPWDLEVTDSTIPPFSDKLIMFHMSLLIASSISNYATASAASLRTDIVTSYLRLAAESAQYAKKGVDIMIKNQWLEQPPQMKKHIMAKT